MARTELVEKETGSGIGRFLFLVTPILFTIVLLGVVLTLMNKETQNKVFHALNQVPVVKNWIPDSLASAGGKLLDQAKSSEATIKELKSELSQKQQEIQKANDQATVQAQTAQNLQSKLDEATQQNEQTAQQTANAAADDYQKQVKKLAQLYGDMNAGKAAAIMSNLTTEENVLMFKSMSNESKAAILEKMDPQLAADISIRLKDSETSEDLAIAALQSRLDKNNGKNQTSQVSSAATGLDSTQMSQTFATMASDKAAALLLQMNKISPEKTLNILHAVDDATRSKILAAMTDTDPAISAIILNKLTSSK